MSESQQSLPSTGGMTSSSQTPPLVEEQPNFKTRKSLVTGPDGAQNQERLCWRGPALIYWTVRLLASQEALYLIGLVNM
jgi:hypothetical protein